MSKYEIQTQLLSLLSAGLLVLAHGTASRSAEVDDTRSDNHSGEAVKAYPESMNKEFVNPHTDIKPFVHKFENDDREVYAKRQAIVRATALSPGQQVADVGAGTGLFTFLFAEKVGPSGIVYAVDISPAFINYIDRRAKQLGLSSVVKPVLSRPDSTELAQASVDVVFLCNTYHHFDHPEEMLASIHRPLRANGRLIVVDFDLRPGATDFVKKRARATREVYEKEITTAGFVPVETEAPPTLRDNFYATYRRTANPKAK